MQLAPASIGDQSAQYEKCHRVKQHDQIPADTGEDGVCDPRIQQIKATLEEFSVRMHHSLNIYAWKRPQLLRNMKVDAPSSNGATKAATDVLTPSTM